MLELTIPGHAAGHAPRLCHPCAGRGPKSYRSSLDSRLRGNDNDSCHPRPLAGTNLDSLISSQTRRPQPSHAVLTAVRLLPTLTDGTPLEIASPGRRPETGVSSFWLQDSPTPQRTFGLISMPFPGPRSATVLRLPSGRVVRNHRFGSRLSRLAARVRRRARVPTKSHQGTLTRAAVTLSWLR